MTAHVAEVSEGSGRVLLWLDGGPKAADGAMSAVMHLASAYGSEVETVDMTPLPPWRFDGLPTGRVNDRAAASAIGIDTHRAHAHLVRRQRRTIAGLAQKHNVPLRQATVSGDPIDQLADMCQQRGPWNIIALSRAPGFDLAGIVGSLFANVSGATGVIVGGRRVQPWRARVAVIAEDSERLPSMLRAAERIAGPEGSVHLIIAAPTKAAVEDLELQSRLIGEGHGGLIFEAAAPTLGVESALDDRLVRAEASMVIARFGGALLANGRALTRALTVSAAPFLLVR